MKGIRAFVGHSFSDHDKPLVSIFCEHFDNLAKAHLGFTWDHAVEAEPSPLSDKVLAKIEGKNVFIGICTKNELAIRDSSLRPAFLRKDLRIATARDFRWKTSDWIIQEIGLAVGRKMSIIIFLEENVREPGGLYGNIEYIPFSRNNPQASFDKLLQMLLSVSPTEPIASTADAEPPLSEERKLAKDAKIDLEPTPEWTKDQYNSANQGETLAMSNLGFRLLGAGFIDEAAEKAKKAVELGTYHAKITDLLKRLKEVPEEEEEKKEAEALEKVRPKAAFYRQPGNAALAQTPNEIGEKWEAPEAVLSASLDGMDVRIWGSYEQDANALMGVGLLGGIIRQRVVRNVEYILKLRGNLLVGEAKRVTDGETSPSLIALGMGKRKVVMYFEPDGTVLHAMESSSFYTLRRVN